MRVVISANLECAFPGAEMFSTIGLPGYPLNGHHNASHDA